MSKPTTNKPPSLTSPPSHPNNPYVLPASPQSPQEQQKPAIVSSSSSSLLSKAMSHFGSADSGDSKNPQSTNGNPISIQQQSIGSSSSFLDKGITAASSFQSSQQQQQQQQSLSQPQGLTLGSSGFTWNPMRVDVARLLQMDESNRRYQERKKEEQDRKKQMDDEFKGKPTLKRLYLFCGLLGGMLNDAHKNWLAPSERMQSFLDGKDPEKDFEEVWPLYLKDSCTAKIREALAWLETNINSKVSGLYTANRRVSLKKLLNYTQADAQLHLCQLCRELNTITRMKHALNWSRLSNYNDVATTLPQLRNIFLKFWFEITDEPSV